MRNSTLVAAGLVVAAMMTLSRADDAKSERPAEEEVRLECKRQECQSANAINFAGEFNLPFPSLVGLGARIENARQTGDPVELASAAQYLATVEKVAEKRAALTSESLMEEAIELARLRRVAEGLKAVAILVGDDRSAELQKLAELATREAEDTQAALEAGEDLRHLSGRLCVNNRSNQYVTILADGNPVGSVPPYGHRIFYVDHARHCIMGRGCMGGFWRRDLAGFHGKFLQLTLHP